MLQGAVVVGEIGMAFETKGDWEPPMKRKLKFYIVLITTGLLLVDLHAAAAETVYAKNTVRIRQQPGERSRVVAKIKSGKKLRVLSRRGRWLKVSANGRTGWVTRTSVTRRDADSAFGGRFDDGKSSTENKTRKKDRDVDDFDEDEDEDEDEDLNDIEAADEIDNKTRRLSRKERRRLKRQQRAEKRRIREEQREKRRQERLARRDSEEEDDDAEDEVDDDGIRVHKKRPKRKRFNVEDEPKFSIGANAALGYGVIGMDFTSNGVGELANYNVGSAAATLRLSGKFKYRKSQKISYGADLSYTGSISSPGIRVNIGGNAADTGFTTHELAAAARLGYSINQSKGMAIVGRLGFHHQVFTISDVNNVNTNLALLPSETLTGATVGGLFEYDRITSKIGAHIGIDALFPASRKQTGGLEDGASSSVLAAWLTMGMTYKFTPKWTGIAGYRYSYADTSWSGAAINSQRGHNATQASRTDTSHLFTVGAATDF